MTSLLLTEGLHLASHLKIGEAKAVWLEILNTGTVTMKGWNVSSLELKAANNPRVGH